MKNFILILCMAVTVNSYAFWGEDKDQHTYADFNFDRMSVDLYLKPNQKLVSIAYVPRTIEQGYVEGQIRFLTRKMREDEQAECYLIEGYSFFNNLPKIFRPAQHKVCEKKEYHTRK